MTTDWDAGRLDSDLSGASMDTLAVRAGQRRSPEGEHGEALFFTSSYVFRSAADAASRFSGEVSGNVYSRYTNPTVRAFEERIAAMEGAEQAVATASGMSAILAMVMSLCSAGRAMPLCSAHWMLSRCSTLACVWARAAARRWRFRCSGWPVRCTTVWPHSKKPPLR